MMGHIGKIVGLNAAHCPRQMSVLLRHIAAGIRPQRARSIGAGD